MITWFPTIIQDFCDKQELKELFGLVRSIEHSLLQDSQKDSREQII